MLHFTNAGAVIFQFALLLSLLPLEDLFFGQIDIYLHLLKFGKDILDCCHSWIQFCSLAIAVTLIQVHSAHFANSFAILFAQNFHRPVYQNLSIDKFIYIQIKSLTEKVQIELESFVSRLGEFPIIEKAPIDLQIANIDGGKLRISGTVDLAASIPCSRCLEEVPTRIHFDIDKEFRLENSAINDEEMEDIDYLIGFDLNFFC